MIRLLGIRHHGPGSARSVKQALEQIRPDLILVEGPPDADSLLTFAGSQEMEPPIALLGYQPDKPQQAIFYPFAVFSPEWQAIQYGLLNQIPVRFMDLPLMHSLAIEKPENESGPAGKSKSQTEEPHAEQTDLPERTDIPSSEDQSTDAFIHRDPLKYLAEAAGYQESELWWEHTFEQRLDSSQVFEAILESMQALRENLPARNDYKEQLREAYMRKMIRQAQQEAFETIVVICGAWHTPALLNLDTRKADDELLKKLPKVKVAFTWIPWTYSRLTFESGYGAGIHSPGWYEHVWNFPDDTALLWLTRVARLFREKQMDTSVAHVIEAVRLADMLALMRNFPRPGLHELNEATQAVICSGEEIRMQLIQDELIVSNKIGKVPPEAPKVPLQHDLEKHQGKLRLPPHADDKVYVLDLRQANDLERSKLLHRLALLNIKWGRKESVSGKGTFKEQWRLRWQPELLVKVIEMGIWGNTIMEASSAYVSHSSTQLEKLSAVAALLQNTIPAELPSATAILIKRINELASAGSDIVQLMEALPPLSQVSRYGNVRKTDTAMLDTLIDGLVARICIGLPNACFALDDEAASDLFGNITEVNQAILLLQQEHHRQLWQQVLLQISHKEQINGLLSGCACRLLLDAKALSGEEAATQFSLALSPGNNPAYSAAWLEGFLKGSGMILLLDNVLWHILNQWVAGLDTGIFSALLPLLRRTFANFSPSERRKMGEKARSENATHSMAVSKTAIEFNIDRAGKSLPVICQLLGIDNSFV